MSYQEMTIQSIGDLITLLPEIYHNQEVWFRGQLVHSWKLEPHLSRIDKLDKEKILMRKFKMNAHQFLESAVTEDYEWLFLMQHFGVPTRLLDWSESPLIGLYFSVFDVKGKAPYQDEDGALWCLYPKKLNSHTVEDILSFGEEGDAAKTLEIYRPNYFIPDVTYNKKPIAILASRQSQRINAQQGVFTISHARRLPIEEIEDQTHVVKIKIPSASKEIIKSELINLKINLLTVFPELANVGELTKENL
jgi:hypothetical protein